jgi:penicillin-binding protein 1A
VYSSEGIKIGEFSKERRYLADIDDIATVLVQAIIAAEDDRFFDHKGINYWSIVRAAIKNVRSFEIRQGGSTITQQVVKSLLLTPERKFSRKIKEAILALRIEKHLSKGEILTLYLNQIYFGNRSYGIEAASRAYFGKPASELNLAEASLLAGLPKAPSHYSPFKNLERAKERQKYVLSRMYKQGFISLEEERATVDAPLVFAEAKREDLPKSSDFLEHVRRVLLKKYGADYVYGEGLRIETTINLAMQEAAEKAVLEGVEAYEKRHEDEMDNDTRVQAALIAMDPFSGHIKAIVGGRDFQESQFNRALQSRRQPGSAFKPVIYAAALDKGYTPASIIVDSPFATFEILENDEYKFWEPQNYGKQFKGPTTFRSALTKSCNTITIKLLKEIGIDYVIKYARQIGADGGYNKDLTLALGSCGISLINMVRAYSTFCAQGVSAEPIYISKIFDRDGNIVEDNTPRLVSTMSPQTAYIMTSLLKSVVEEGTGRKVRALKRPCAGKTGTTNEGRDAWFMGYTPQLVAGTWIGFDNFKSLGKKETGSSAASPIWLSFMQEALKDEPVRHFKIPEGIVFMRINPETGYYPEEKKDKTIFECFKEGTLPSLFEQEYIPGKQVVN